MKNIIYIIIITAIFNSCIKLDGTDYRLKIKNNTSKYLYYNDQNGYPDTTIEEFNNISLKDSYLIDPNSERRIPTQVPWERIFEKNLKSDTLMIFIYDAAVIENTTWDTVKAKYMILKRYDLSLEDLQRMNWTITYP
jgi:hypothetical protein